MTHVLYYPQKPICYTKASELTKMDELPASQECVVMIAALDGFNQDDAVILNKSSVERGLFRSVYYRTYRDEEKKLGNHYSEEIEVPVPEKTYGYKDGDYSKLDADGIIEVGAVVSENTILLGKTCPYVSQSEGGKTSFTKRDHSLSSKSSERGKVDRVRKKCVFIAKGCDYYQCRWFQERKDQS